MNILTTRVFLKIKILSINKYKHVCVVHVCTMYDTVVHIVYI